MGSVILSRFCLPWGKADECALSEAKSRSRGSPLLSKARSRRLRLRPWCRS